MDNKSIPYSIDTASIGVSLDAPNKKETVVIGSPENVKRFFTVGIEEDVDVRTRKLGSLVDEMNALAQADGDSAVSEVITAANGLCGIINSGQGNKAAAEFIDTLQNIYDTSANPNMLLNYIIFFVLTNFNQYHKALIKRNHILRSQMKKSAKTFAELYNVCVSDMLLPFRNLPTIPESNVRYWDIDEQINSAQTDLILHIYSSHSSGTWRTGYAADNSFLAILRTYVDILKQANVVVRNCCICRKLIISDRANVSEICGNENCKREQHRMTTNTIRKRNRENPIQDFYDKFSSSCSNLRRKLGADTEERKKFDIEFEKARKNALKMKKGLSEDSPNQEIYAYSSYLSECELRLRKLAEDLVKSG